MPLDTGIYNALMRPVKSAAEYQQDFAAADMAALNRDQARLAAQDDMAIRNALAGVAGRGQEEQIRALQGTGNLGAIRQAQGMQAAQAKAMQEAAQTQKTLAETDKTSFETRMARTQQHLGQLAGVTDIDGAMRWLDEAAASGELPADRVAAAKQTLQQNPQGFGQWKQQAMMGGVKVAEQLAMTAPKPQEIDLGDRKVFVDMNPQSQTYGRPIQSMAKSASPDALVLAGTQRMGQQIQREGQEIQRQRMEIDRADTESKVREREGKTGSAKPLTEGQSKALLFGSRMRDSQAVIDQLAQSGVDGPGALRRYAGDGILGDLANASQSPQQQQAEQAQRDFINATLRRESGAAIAKSEFESARKQYFPQVGDSPEVIAQKKRNRELAIEGMLAEVPEDRRSSVGQSARQNVGATKVVNEAQYNALPSGAMYIGPDGQMRRKR